MSASPLAALAVPTPASAAEDVQITVQQNGQEVATVSPITTDRSIQDFYRYDRIDNASANTPLNLRESDVSKLFFYRRSGSGNPLSLVIIHDTVRDGNGGAVRFDFQPNSLPSGGSWVVRDDSGDSSYGRTSVRWGWAPCCTDGGAYRGGFEDGVQVTIDPTFIRGIGRWDLLDGDGSIATKLDDAPVTLSIGGVAVKSLIEDKETLISDIRSNATAILPASQASELDKEADALLEELKESLSNNRDPVQLEALDRMVLAEGVTASGVRAGIEPTIETAETMADLGLMAVLERAGNALLRGAGSAGRLIAARLRYMGRQARRIFDDLVGWATLPRSIRRNIEDHFQQATIAVKDVLELHEDTLEAAGKATIRGGLPDGLIHLTDAVLDAFSAIRDTFVSVVTFLLYIQYLNTNERIDDEGQQVSPPGLDTAIDDRIPKLRDLIQEGSLSAEGRDGRRTVRDDSIDDITARSEEAASLLRTNRIIAGGIQGIALIVILAGLIMAGLALALAATGVGVALAVGLAAIAKNIVIIGLGLGAFAALLLFAGVEYGVMALLDMAETHDVGTRDIVTNGV